jgi:hypothetical protein
MWSRDWKMWKLQAAGQRIYLSQVRIQGTLISGKAKSNEAINKLNQKIKPETNLIKKINLIKK